MTLSNSLVITVIVQKLFWPLSRFEMLFISVLLFSCDVKVVIKLVKNYITLSEGGLPFSAKCILVPTALLTRGATRGSGQIHIRTGIWLASSNTGYCFLTMFLWYPVMDLARAPRRDRSNARKKGSGYENVQNVARWIFVIAFFWNVCSQLQLMKSVPLDCSYLKRKRS
jgi:hypothetical protein